MDNGFIMIACNDLYAFNPATNRTKVYQRAYDRIGCNDVGGYLAADTPALSDFFHNRNPAKLITELLYIIEARTG